MSSRTSSSIGHPVTSGLEALDQLRGVGAAAADDGDLQAHAPSLQPWGLTPIAYNVISNRRVAQARNPRSVARGPPRPMARFRLELGPIPLHHQVYLDLRAALDAGEWKPGDRLPTERDLASRYGCSLITVRRALGELAREQRLERTRGRGHVRPAPADRSRLRRRAVVHRGDADARPRPGRRGWSRRGPSRPARPSPTRCGLELGSPTLYLERLRLADGEPLLLEQVHLPAERFPGPARLRPRARLALRPADRALRRPRRTGARGPRAGPAARPRGAPARPQAGHAGPARSKASHPPRRAARSSSAGPSCVAIGRATTWSAWSCARTGRATTDKRRRRRSVRWLVAPPSGSRTRRSTHANERRAAWPSCIAVAGARRVGLQLHRRPARRPRRGVGEPGGIERQGTARGVRRRAVGDTGPDAAAAERILGQAPGDVARPLVLLPRHRRRSPSRSRSSRRSPTTSTPRTRASTCSSRATSSPRPATRCRSSSAPATAPDIVGPVGVGGAEFFHGQWLDLQPLIDKNKFDMTQFPSRPSTSTTSAARARSASRSPSTRRSSSTRPACSRRPGSPSRPTSSERQVHDARRLRWSRGTTTRSRSSRSC